MRLLPVRRKEFRSFAHSDLMRSEIVRGLPFIDIPIDLDGSGDPRPERPVPLETIRADSWPDWLLPLGTPVSHFFMTRLAGSGLAALGFPRGSGNAQILLCLKGIVIADSDSHVLPPLWNWLSGVVNLQEGSPNANRSMLRNDEALDNFRQEVGRLLTGELSYLTSNLPERFHSIFSEHRISILTLLLESSGLLAAVSSALHFETTLGTLTFHEVLARAEEDRGERTIFFTDRSPLGDYRWTTFRGAGSVAIWCRDSLDTSVLKALVSSSPVTCLLKLDWGATDKVRSELPAIPVNVQLAIERIRRKLELYHVSVDPVLLSPASLPGAVELSGTHWKTLSQGAERQSAVIRAIARFHAKLKNAVAPEQQGRLLVNIASDSVRSLLERDSDLAAALLFAATITRTGLPFPVEWQRVLSDLVDTAIGHASEALPGTPEHVVCFFAHEFRSHKPLLSAIRSVLEHRPFFWEVRSADEVLREEMLIENVMRHIRESRIFIGEITNSNANVMLEVGAAMAMPGSRSVMLLAEKSSYKGLSDLDGRLILYYEAKDVASGALARSLRK